MLEVDNRVILPEITHTRFILTAAAILDILDYVLSTILYILDIMDYVLSTILYLFESNPIKCDGGKPLGWRDDQWACYLLL